MTLTVSRWGWETNKQTRKETKTTNHVAKGCVCTKINSLKFIVDNSILFVHYPNQKKFKNCIIVLNKWIWNREIQSETRKILDKNQMNSVFIEHASHLRSTLTLSRFSLLLVCSLCSLAKLDLNSTFHNFYSNAIFSAIH